MKAASDTEKADQLEQRIQHEGSRQHWVSPEVTVEDPPEAGQVGRGFGIPEPMETAIMRHLRNLVEAEEGRQRKLRCRWAAERPASETKQVCPAKGSAEKADTSHSVFRQ